MGFISGEWASFLDNGLVLNSRQAIILSESLLIEFTDILHPQPQQLS